MKSMEFVNENSGILGMTSVFVAFVLGDFVLADFVEKSTPIIQFISMLIFLAIGITTLIINIKKIQGKKIQAEDADMD